MQNCNLELYVRTSAIHCQKGSGRNHLCHEGVWLGAVQDPGEGHMLSAPITSPNHFVGAIPASANSGCVAYALEEDMQ